MDILQKIELDNSKIENIREKMINPVKVQLHSGIEGFKSPNNYGVYRNTGGDCLGVVGKSFNPLNLDLLLDSVIHSILESELDLDVNKLEYTEYKKGAKIAFSVPLKTYEIKKSKMVGDLIESKLLFKTGFDGKTMTSVSYFTKRLWCKNGASSWKSDYNVAFKNTTNSQNKIFNLCEGIVQINADVENYIQLLNDLALKPITVDMEDEYFQRVFGINRKTYLEEKTRRQNVLNSIHEVTAIELKNTGDNLFSLLQGTTRYLTHNIASQSEEALMYSGAALTNTLAHKVAYDLCYN